MVPATTAKLIAWMDELSVAWSTHQKQHHAECLAKNMRRGRFCVINSHAYSPLHWMKIFTLCWWHYIQVLSPSLNRSIPGAADSSANSTGQPSYSWCSWSKKLCLGGKYTSARYYRFLFERVPKNEIMISIWSSKTLPKIKVFLWLRMLDRLNTRDIMSRKNWTVDSGTDCS